MTFKERKELVDKEYPLAPESFREWFAKSGITFRQLKNCREAWYQAMMKAASIADEHQAEMARWTINENS